MITFTQYIKTLLTEAEAPAPAGGAASAPPIGGPPAGGAPTGIGAAPAAPPPMSSTPDLGSLGAPTPGADMGLGGGLSGGTQQVSAANIKISNVWDLQKKYWNQRSKEQDLLAKKI